MSEGFPSRHSVRRVKQQAKEILNAHQRGDASVCALLRRLRQYRNLTDSQILTRPDVKLTTVHSALARAAGIKSWSKYIKQLATIERGAAPAPTGAVVGEPALDVPPAVLTSPVVRPLFNGNPYDNWWILDGCDHFELHGDELIVHNPSGKGLALHALVGGMSWDHYKVRLELFVEPSPSSGTYNVQFRAIGSDDSMRMDRGQAVHRHVDRETGRAWNVMAGRAAPAGSWHTYEALFDEAGSGHWLDGERLIYQPHVDWGRLPRLPHGLLELAVNIDSAARIRLRKFEVEFLKPDPIQLRELGINARVNVEEYNKSRRPPAA